MGLCQNIDIQKSMDTDGRARLGSAVDRFEQSTASTAKVSPLKSSEALSHHFQAPWIVCEDVAAPYEQAYIQQLKDAQLKVQTVWQSTLMRLADLPFDVRNVPDQFTTFRQLVKRPTMHVKNPLPVIQRCQACPMCPG